eukprot:CAMPEP_0194284592 /NCGR_PEP_ID=MMETSP0169-20130528/27953_1 /TAXON_ID=218684 /ORGANISM="Corethron pennatum, Strain L29A3" /LENGTH=190 /DNA_ID=CAMNT_0039030435 /DNA_START=21 /DNA_END=593 /DNA_ORIENTATION=-
MDILALSQLLQDASTKPREKNLKNGDSTPLITPESISPTHAKNYQYAKSPAFAPLATSSKQPNRNNDICCADEPNHSDIPIQRDTRIEPTHEIYYRQTVGAEEIFLGSTERTPASFDCTHLIVKVYFPGELTSALKLDVTETTLVAESRQHLLALCLPCRVKKEGGTAKWDKTTEVLAVTLPIASDDFEF